MDMNLIVKGFIFAVLVVLLLKVGQAAKKVIGILLAGYVAYLLMSGAGLL